MVIAPKSNVCIKCNEALGNDDRCWNPACSLAGIFVTNTRRAGEPLRETKDPDPEQRHNEPDTTRTGLMRELMGDAREVTGSVRLISP